MTALAPGIAQCEPDAVVRGPTLENDAGRKRDRQLERRIQRAGRGGRLRAELRNTARERPHSVRDRMLEAEKAGREIRHVNRVEIAGDARISTPGSGING